MAPVDNNDDVETGDEAVEQPRKKLKIKLVTKKKNKGKKKGKKNTGTNLFVKMNIRSVLLT